jgi:hypothetical protein
VASKFDVGATYTRDDVANEIGLPADKRGGNWNTGYGRWNGEFFIFCNVGSPGRTGHDYANRWYGSDLIWFGKSQTTLNQAEVRDLLSGNFPVHLFWRGDDRAPFTYAGMATAVEAQDTTPVEVIWTFNSILPKLAAGGPGTATWRRGPPPSWGEQTIHKQDSPTSVYVMTLDGVSADTFPKRPNELAVVKLGMSNDPLRRLDELNWGFPPGCSLRWRLVTSKLYASGPEAFDAEGQLLDRFRLSGHWLGGEFVYAASDSLEQLLLDG